MDRFQKRSAKSLENTLRYIDLAPIYHPHEIFEEVQERIEKRFLTQIYWPVLSLLQVPRDTLQNSKESDLRAIEFALSSGKLTFNRGTFSGKYNASIAKALRSLGAEFDKRSSTYKIHYSKLPQQIQGAVDSSDRAFSSKLRKIDTKLADILKVAPSKVTVFKDLFDHAIYRASESFEENVKKVGITAKLNWEQEKVISDQWQNNLDLDIKGWEQEHIQQLRALIKESYFAGDRYGTLLSTIQESYGVSESKAAFLARQETKLLVSAYTQSQYQKNGFPEYKWKCVVGSAAHPVRPMHQALNNTIQRWDSPPVTNKNGDHNAPGCDWGCRCYPQPIIRV